MPTILITGASSQIGLEFVRQYLKSGFRVYATYRTKENSKELFQIKNSNLQIEWLDLALQASIAKLKSKIAKTPIDILINNAARQGGILKDSSFGDLSIKEWLDTFLVNTIGQIKVSEAFIENIKSSKLKRIVFISSRAGSIETRGKLPHQKPGGDYIYRTSKAALNAAARSLAFDQKINGIKVLILHPGFVSTNATSYKADISAIESVQGMISIIQKLRISRSGLFFDYRGTGIPW